MHRPRGIPGLRLYLLAFVFTLPDILAALVGFDWSPLLPARHEGLGVRIGAGISLARLVLVPALKGIRDAARRPGSDGDTR